MSRSQGIRALLLEFVIIVAGVLVALGVDEWRGERRDRALELEYASRLQADLERDTASLAGLERWALSDKAELLRSFLTDESLEIEDPAALMRRLEVSTYGGVTGAQTAAFREMESTGRLGLLRDPELRTAVSQYYFQQEFIAGRYDESFGPYLQLLAGAFPGTLQYDWMVGSVDVPRDELEAGLNTLRRHPDFKSAVNAELRYAASLLFWYREIRQDTEALLRRLAEVYPD